MNKFISFFFILFISCSTPVEAPPAGLLDKEKFADVMLDIQILEGMKTQRVIGLEDGQWVDSIAYADVFKKHGISWGSFITTYEFYRGEPGKMAGIYELVLDSLSALDAQVKQEYSEDRKLMSDSLREATEEIRDSTRAKILRK